MDYKDYYKILGVDRDTKQEEKKRAYRKLARKFYKVLIDLEDSYQRAVRDFSPRTPELDGNGQVVNKNES